MNKVLSTLLLLIPSLIWGSENLINIDEFRLMIESKYRDLGFYERDLIEERNYQNDLEKIKYNERAFPNSPLHIEFKKSVERMEKSRIERITSSILENKYFEIKDKLLTTSDLNEINSLKEQMKEAKRVFTLYTYGAEYELADCWEERNCYMGTFSSPKSNDIKDTLSNIIYVEPPKIDIWIID